MRENNEEEQFVPSAFFQAPNQMASKTPIIKKNEKTHENHELIEVSISMATQNSFDDAPSQSAGRAWPNHGTDWCSVACY